MIFFFLDQRAIVPLLSGSGFFFARQACLRKKPGSFILKLYRKEDNNNAILLFDPVLPLPPFPDTMCLKEQIRLSVLI